MWRRSPGPAARVPDLIGLEVRVAQDLALDAGVLAVEARPAVARSGVVTGQNPGPGRRVRVGSRVWIRVGPRAEPDDGPGNGTSPYLDDLDDALSNLHMVIASEEVFTRAMQVGRVIQSIATSRRERGRGNVPADLIVAAKIAEWDFA